MSSAGGDRGAPGRRALADRERGEREAFVAFQCRHRPLAPAPTRCGAGAGAQPPAPRPGQLLDVSRRAADRLSRARPPPPHQPVPELGAPGLRPGEGRRARPRARRRGGGGGERAHRAVRGRPRPGAVRGARHRRPLAPGRGRGAHVSTGGADAPARRHARRRPRCAAAVGRRAGALRQRRQHHRRAREAAGRAAARPRALPASPKKRRQGAEKLARPSPRAEREPWAAPELIVDGPRSPGTEPSYRSTVRASAATARRVSSISQNKGIDRARCGASHRAASGRARCWRQRESRRRARPGMYVFERSTAASVARWRQDRSAHRRRGQPHQVRATHCAHSRLRRRHLCAQARRRQGGRRRHRARREQGPLQEGAPHAGRRQGHAGRGKAPTKSSATRAG